MMSKSKFAATIQLRSTMISLQNGSVGLHLDGARWLLCKPQAAPEFAPIIRCYVNGRALAAKTLTLTTTTRKDIP